jgi:antirestriction protein ArdC
MATATKTRKKTPVRHEARVTNKPVRDAHQETVDQIIAALEAGMVPWQKDWVNVAGDMPTSLTSYKEYQGSNVLVLWIASLTKGYTSKYWGTYDEMAERAGLVKIPRPGGRGHFWVSPDLEDGTRDPQPRGVRKGEKATVIVKPLQGSYQAKDDAGNVIIDPKTGRPEIRTYHKLIVHNVYNADQCSFPEGCKGVPQDKPAGPDVDPIEAAEALVADYLADGPSLAWGGNSAHYVPTRDHVQMPARNQFKSPAGLYSTLYHELVHSTGHDSREAREGIKKGSFGAFGDAVYSFEELVAEIGSAFLCGHAGIPQEAHLDNSAAYIAHWLKALKEDKKLIFKAASEATRAVARVMGTATTTSNESEES